MADISLFDTSTPPLAGAVTALNQIFATWRQRARERRELANLDYRTLRDLALNPGDIQFEASKPFWRA